MEEIISNGRVVRGALGFNGDTHPSGIIVSGVNRGGPADKAGLQVRDIILSLDGLATTNVRNTLDYITNTAPGRIVKVEVLRDRQKLVLPMTVTELR
jgi:serine protease DegS